MSTGTIMKKLDRSSFPQKGPDFRIIGRVPVLYRPVIGSPEVLIIGAVCYECVREPDRHLARVGGLSRLKALFGADCDGLIVAIGLALDALEAALKDPDFSFVAFKPPMWNMLFGDIEHVEGSSLEESAMIWLRQHSSLYESPEQLVTARSLDAPATPLGIARALVGNDPSLSSIDLIETLLLAAVSDMERAGGVKSAEDYGAAELVRLMEGKIDPIMIPHEGDRIAFFLATDEERSAWNAYARNAAAEFDADPSLDSYDSHRVFSGRTRDGASRTWCPPIWFPEWLASRKGTAPFIVPRYRIPHRNGVAPVSWLVTSAGKALGDEFSGDFSAEGIRKLAIWHGTSAGYKVEYRYPETVGSGGIEEHLHEWSHWKRLNDQTVARRLVPSDSEIDAEAEAWSAIMRILKMAKE